MNKETFKDFIKFSLIEKITCVIDLILNPMASDWPITYFDFNPEGYKRNPYGFLFKVKTTKVGDSYKMLYVRWK